MHTSVVMRRLFVVVALIIALVAVPGGVARSKPAIHVTRVIPITVKGTGFASRERVKVIVRIPATYRKTVTATGLGRFTATFRIASGKCSSIRALATGNKGSRATAYVPPSCRI